MTYTGEDSDTSGVNIQEIGYRALTESHGATAPLYRAFSGGTSDDVGSPPTGNWQPTRHRKQQNKRAENIAKREHIARLLRNCRKLVESLKRSDDRTELAQTGSMLCDMLDEIWQYRLAREEDWIEVVNALQIVLRDESFETMQEPKKDALVNLFSTTLVPRTISRAEAARASQLLANAGFKLWRGLQIETTGTVDQRTD